MTTHDDDDTDFDSDLIAYPRYRCPKCETYSVVQVMYGLPCGSMFRAAERGDVILGGCSITINIGYPPANLVSCTACGAEHIVSSTGELVEFNEFNLILMAHSNSL